MTGLRCSHCSVDRLVITHLAEQDDIRTLAQRRAKCGQVAFRVRADFSLGYDAFFVAMQELKRILERDHVILAFVVDPVNEAGECCGLTASGRSGHKNHATSGVCEIHDGIRNVQFTRLRKREGNHTDDS